jgi:glycosyltransferase involved in cell wall biosynthesis
MKPARELPLEGPSAVTRILFLIADLDYGGLARQLTLLASHLPRERFQTRLAVLAGSSPWVEELRQGGQSIDLLGWRRPFDLSPFRALSRLLKEYRPDIIHLWGPLALRGLCLAGGPRKARVLMTGLLPARGKPAWLDRWLWGKRARIVTLGESEADRYRRLGAAANRLEAAWPAVVVPSEDPELPVGRLPSLPEHARVILAVGPFQANKGHKDAVWTIDILHYLYPALHLVLVGDGPERQRIQRFRDLIRMTERVHFVGTRASVGPWLRRAELVWVPSRGASGINVALEAMAAGKAVVASRLPALAEIVEEGKTGLLARPGDKPDLARQTRLLFDDPKRCQALGDAGLALVSRRFSLAGMVERFTEIYQHS